MAVALTESFNPVRDPLRLRRHLILGGLTVALVIACLAASTIGALSIPFSHVVAALMARLGIDLGIPLSPFEDAALL